MLIVNCVPQKSYSLYFSPPIAYNIVIMEKNLFTFSDGLKLVHCKIDGVYSAYLSVMTGVGSGNETEENNGISHCVEHMLFKGTKRRSAFQISEDIDKIGAQINAFTSKLATCYYTTGLAEHLEECADVLSDILFDHTLDEGELDKERKVIDEEISMSEDDGADLCLDNLSGAYFGAHPLGRTILGPRSNVARFTSEDLREYIAQNYASDSTVVTIVGNVEFERAKAVAEKYFTGRMKRAGRKWQDVPAAPHMGYSYTHKPELEQSHVGIAFPSLPYKHEKDATLAVVNAILGGNMSSRLFQEVREKQGLAYSVFSSPSAYINNGYMCIYAGVKPSNVQKAVRTIADLLLGLKANPITKGELEKGKQQIKTAYALSGESTSGSGTLFARFALYTGGLFNAEEEIKRVDKVTLDEANALALQVLNPQKAALSYVGKKCKDDLLKIFKGE